MPSKPVKPIDLYIHGLSCPSRAVWMMFEALGTPHNVKIVDLQNKEHMAESYLKMNPCHTVPTIDDNGFYLYESRAIMMYVIAKYADDDHALYPHDAQKRAKINQWLNYEMDMWNTFMPSVFQKLFMKKAPEQAQVDKIEAKLAQFDKFLSQSKYLAGDCLTIADLSGSQGVVQLWAADIVDLHKYNNVVTWIKKLKELPYWKKCNEEIHKFAEQAKAK